MPRPHDQLREIEIRPNFLPGRPASVWYRSGGTIVLCHASVEDDVPPWMAGRGRGWVTAEYNMLPGSTSPRKRRERGGKVDGRTTEIQRLIGRSLRAAVDFDALGERTVHIDCDVLAADGGTRTAAITGGWVALAAAVAAAVPGSGAKIGSGPITDHIAAVSVGVVGGQVTLDLDYPLDSAADVDMNVVMTGGGQFVEIQGTGERTTFDGDQLSRMLDLARGGLEALVQAQRSALASIT